MSQLPWVLLASAGAAVGLQLITWLVSLVVKRVSIVDITWGLGFAVVSVAGFLASTGSGDDVRRVLLVAMTCIWGLRLAFHIGARQFGAEEDPRYVEMLARSSGPSALVTLRKVFLLQAVAAWFISLPIQVGLVDTGGLLFAGSIGPLAYLGIVSWLVGFYFEAVGDRQLSRFRADPSTKGTVLQTGLWRYTRHPNYFGDACVWWGIFLVAADAGWAFLTVLSPILMTWFLTAKTGKPLLEKQLARSRPGYAEYVERTSGFIPLPPKKQAPKRTP